MSLELSKHILKKRDTCADTEKAAKDAKVIRLTMHLVQPALAHILLGRGTCAETEEAAKDASQKQHASCAGSLF